MVASASAQTERNYPRFNFNIGGGYGIGRGDTAGFVGNSFQASAGAGLNFSRIFGVDAEYMYYDMPFRQSVAVSQNLGSANASLNIISLNGIVRAPFHVGRYGAYGIFGVGFYDRNTYSNTGSVNLATCQPSWRWWDIYCFDGRVPASPPQSLGSYTKIAGGYNFGGGLTFDLNRWHHSKIYAEFRIHKPYFSDSEMGAWPFTVGLRW
jgi:Outer membrane protein beta-barrel domain